MTVPNTTHVVYAYVNYTDTAAKELFALPAGAIPLFANVQVEVAFNDTGTDVLDIGIPGTADYFVADQAVSAPGGAHVALAQCPLLTAPATVTATYTGQNSNASAGRALVVMAYMTPFGFS